MNILIELLWKSKQKELVDFRLLPFRVGENGGSNSKEVWIFLLRLVANEIVLIFAFKLLST